MWSPERLCGTRPTPVSQESKRRVLRGRAQGVRWDRRSQTLVKVVQTCPLRERPVGRKAHHASQAIATL